MREELEIAFKQDYIQKYNEKELDCSNLTIKGHSAAIIQAWLKGEKGVYLLDRHNAVLLSEVISICISTPNTP